MCVGIVRGFFFLRISLILDDELLTLEEWAEETGHVSAAETLNGGRYGPDSEKSEWQDI
jgi:hypothetical protein